MQDYIVRATAAGSTVRVFAAITTEMVREAREVHLMSPEASAALGRTITAAALMSGLLKDDLDTMTIQIKGDGPLGGIVVTTDSKANVRGYVNNPNVYLPLNSQGKLDVAGAVGRNGYLNIIRDIGLREPYIGYVKLVSGEIGEDLAYYFAFSEQIPTVVALGVLVDKDESIINAGGYIIQLMPGAEESIINYIENTINCLPSVTNLIQNGETPEGILEILFGEKDLKIADKTPCKYLCNCSRERMERNLISLGHKEIAEIVDENKGAELQCQFCSKKYQFSQKDMIKIKKEIEDANSNISDMSENRLDY
jgi:molecular chaperone Hsp33